MSVGADEPLAPLSTRPGMLSRRAAFTRLGGVGIGVVMAAPAMRVLAQDATPAAGDLPPVVAEYVAAWEAFDIDRLGPLLAEDVVLDEVAFGTVVEGRDAVLADYRDFFAAFSDISADYVNAFAADTYAAAEWVFSGRYINQLPGLPPPEGQEFTVRGVDILELEGDTITVIREYANALALLMQLGALPSMMEEGATPAASASETAEGTPDETARAVN